MQTSISELEIGSSPAPVLTAETMLLCMIGELQQGLGLMDVYWIFPTMRVPGLASFPERCVLHPGQWIYRPPRVASNVCPHDQRSLHGQNYSGNNTSKCILTGSIVHSSADNATFRGSTEKSLEPFNLACEDLHVLCGLVSVADAILLLTAYR